MAWICMDFRQSHYIEVAQGAIFVEQNMYEIWADFGTVGNTEKKWADYEQFLRVFS